MSKKSSSSRIRASFSALSTSASGVGAPYFSSRSFSSEPAFTPMRIGTPRSFASRAISRTLSWYLMLPGIDPQALDARPRAPPSRTSTGSGCRRRPAPWTSRRSRRAPRRPPSAGTATRTMSTPAATSDAICCSVALMSAVFVVVIDWIETGASPPIGDVADVDLPRLPALDGHRQAVSQLSRRTRGT